MFAKVRRLLPAALLVAAPVAAGAALAAATPAAAGTTPSVTYQMFDNTCSFGGPCREKVTVTSNPSNYAVRAYVNCYNAIPNTQATVVGNWVFNVGVTSTSASCDSLGRASSAGFEFKKTGTLFVQCWLRGGSWGPGPC